MPIIGGMRYPETDRIVLNYSHLRATANEPEVRASEDIRDVPKRTEAQVRELEEMQARNERREDFREMHMKKFVF